MNCDFEVGDKIICIDDDFGILDEIFFSPDELPKKDQIYTVKALTVCNSCNTPLVELKELNDWWHTYHFRKLITQDLSIEQFTKENLLSEKEIEELKKEFTKIPEKV